MASDPCTGQPQAMYAGSTGAQRYPGVVLCSDDSTIPGVVGSQAYTLQFQSDCNLVLLTGRSKPLWSSTTGGGNCNNANSCLVMQGDGNLVIYYPNGCGNQVRWASGTGGHALDQYCARLGYDGNLVIYVPGNPCGSNPSYLTGPNSPSWTQSGHTRPIEGADSWRTWPVVEGRTTCQYPCKSTNIYFRAWNGYSSRQPLWDAAITPAVSAWNVGPITYSFNAGPNMTWTYIYASFPGDTTYPYDTCGSYLNSTVPGVTVDFNQSGAATSDWQALNIYYTQVCLNQNLLSPGGTDVTNAAAHELGHTVGLAHNPSDTTSIMYPSQTQVQAPNNNDIGGPAPGCPNRDATYGGYGGGVMCIYGWGD